jgi:hypothetical protein
MTFKVNLILSKFLAKLWLMFFTNFSNQNSEFLLSFSLTSEVAVENWRNDIHGLENFLFGKVVSKTLAVVSSEIWCFWFNKFNKKLKFSGSNFFKFVFPKMKRILAAIKSPSFQNCIFRSCKILKVSNHSNFQQAQTLENWTKKN